MFDSLVLRRHRAGPDLVDPGFLAECLIFYGTVHVAAGRAVLSDLVRKVEGNSLFALIDEGYLVVHYADRDFGVITHNTNTPMERHAFTDLKIEGSMDLDRAVASAFENAGRSRRQVRAFTKRVVPDEPNVTATLEAVRADALDEEFCSDAVRVALQHLAPDYNPGQLEFFVEPVDDREVRVTTNIDFSRANESHHKIYSPDYSSLTPAFLLSTLIQARADLDVALRLGGDIGTDTRSAELLALKFDAIVSAALDSHEKIDVFAEHTLGGAHAIAEAINSGRAGFDDIFDVLQRGRRFRQWLRDQPVDADLLMKYYEEITSKTWIERLPSRSVRTLLWAAAGIGVTALGGGALATGTAAALGVADNLVLDRLLHGWRPNQFVDITLRQFKT